MFAACSMKATGDFCSLYEPVPTLHCGTALQNLRVDGNNAVYLDQCKKKRAD